LKRKKVILIVFALSFVHDLESGLQPRFWMYEYLVFGSEWCKFLTAAL